MSALRRHGSWLVVLWLLCAPASAQLLDDPLSGPEPRAEEATAAPEAKEPPPPTRRPKKRVTSPVRQSEPPAEVRRSDPPPGIARPGADAPAPAAVESRNPLLILFLSLLGVGLVLFLVERARGWLTTNLALTRFFGALVLVLRLVAVTLLLAIVLKVLPGGQDWIIGGMVILALVIGWSVRDLFADLVAGGVLAAERRVKRGVWVSGEGFQGTVEGRSLRATWLRDAKGGRLTVPNRAMVGAPMVFDAGADAEHEVEVRLEGYEDAGKVRIALTDAILSSPWVIAGATPVVLRDPADPVVWRVRTKLLEPRFLVHFEGELLERVEDLLRYEPVPDDERETIPGELPVEG